MGVDFRGKGYVKSVRIGKRTVKEGEAAAVWDQSGNHTQVVGPKLQRLWWSTIRFLERHVAEESQYLRIRHRDGTVQHIRGPTELYENPVYHLGVSVHNATLLQNESCHLVVQRVREEANPEPKSPKGESAASQLVISGPKVFFPEPADTIQMFRWTAKGAGVLEQGGCVLNAQAQMQRAMDCTVQSGDDHNVTISVTLCARVLGLKEAMSVPDPVAECDSVVKSAITDALGAVHLADQGSAVQALVRAALASKDLTSKLDANLRERAACEFVAMVVQKIKPSEDLHKIARRGTELANAKLKAQVADVSLEAAAARQQREQQMEAAKQTHELKLAANRAVAEHSSGDDEATRAVAFLKELKDMNVDLTHFLCTQDDNVEGRSQAAQSAKKAGLGWW